MMHESKKIVHDYIKKLTINFLKDENHYIENTQEIADKCSLSRSVVSKYLNKLYGDNLLIKIATRPVIYLDRYILEKEIGRKMLFHEYLSYAEFYNEIQKSKRDDVFSDVIGRNGSLKDLILGIKSMKNNRNHIFILLSGKHGTGKSYISKIIYNYLCNKKNKMITLSCTEGQHDYLDLLFNSTYGLYYQATNSLLILENFDVVDYKVQKDIIFKIKNMLNDEKIANPNYLIITVTQKNNIASSLFDQINYSYDLLDLNERPVKEKEELVLKRLKLNENNLQKKIYVSKLVFYSLVHFRYPFNIASLNQIIDELIVNANNEQKNADKICIYQYHLSIDLIKNIDFSKNSEKKELLSLQQIQDIIFNNKLIIFCKELKERFEYYIQYQNDYEGFIKEIHQKVNQYCDYIVFERKININHIKIIENVVKTAFEIIENKYKLVMNSGVSTILARFLYENTYVDTRIKNWEIQNKDFINSLEIFIGEQYSSELEFVNEIDNSISGMLEIKMDIISKLYLILNLSDAVSSLEQYNKIGLVIAHGYSTATSISESVNRIIGKNVIKGIDMPIDTQTSEIIIKVRNYILSKSIFQEIILLVDMGSLEKISQEVSNFTSRSVGIINNISTKTALSVGYGILNDKPIDEILEEAKVASLATIHIISKKMKSKAIVFTFDSGLNSAERTMQIFKSSMPKKVEIQFIAVDYFELIQSDKAKEIADTYDVMFFVGTYATQIEIAPFIALEEIISIDNKDKLYSLLRSELTNDEIKQLNSNLLRNFSLENIMRNLTILNPTTLMDFIDEALKRLQRELGKKFNNKVMAGLYLHISCMVERLVTKMDEIPHENLDRFEEDHSEFIEKFRSCFKKLIEHYNINIPLSEIAYLYDYIENGFTYLRLNEKEGEILK